MDQAHIWSLAEAYAKKMGLVLDEGLRERAKRGIMKAWGLEWHKSLGAGTFSNSYLPSTEKGSATDRFEMSVEHFRHSKRGWKAKMRSP